MRAIPELAIDERLEARVRAKRRDAAALVPGVPRAASTFEAPDVEGHISPGAQRRDAIYKRSLMAADVIAATLALTLSVLVVADTAFKPQVAAALIVVIGVGKVLGLYERDELVFHKSTLDEVPKLFQLGAGYALATWLLGPLLLEGDFTRAAAVTLVVSAFVLSVLLRHSARSFAGRMAPRERCLIIGRSGTRMRFAGKLAAALPHTDVVGYLPLDDERRRQRQGAWQGQERRRQALGIGDLDVLVRELDVHRVVVIPGEADSETMIDAVSRAKASGVKVSLLPRLFEIVGSSVEFDNIDGVTILGVRRFGLSRSSEIVKRGLDITAATLGLVVLAPLFLAVAIAVRLDSRGPVFYRQWRIGRGGQPFRMLKFRSMIEHADLLKDDLHGHNDAGGGLFKIVDDPRITRIGRIIRKASIDELPQLWNVLRGEMSLVGPRPLVPDEDGRVDGRFRRRLRLVPGMTGPWQILGPTRVPLGEMVVLDYLYGANWSLWLDVKIMIRTIGHVLSRRGV